LFRGTNIDVRRGAVDRHHDAVAGLILEIDIRELLAGAVRHDEGGAYILDGPRRRGSGEPSLAVANSTA
jgi:hypothetical protein